MTADPDAAVRFAVLFLAALVVLRSAVRIIATVVDAIRFRRAIRTCARELEASERNAYTSEHFRNAGLPCVLCGVPCERGYCRQRECMAWMPASYPRPPAA